MPVEDVLETGAVMSSQRSEAFWVIKVDKTYETRSLGPLMS